MSRKPQQGPLQGIRILDLSRLLPGPLATQLMADMGAEVIKIEDPKAQDMTRFFPPMIKNQSLFYLSINRSKLSVTLSLKTEEGKQQFMELVKTADVVFDSFRPGVLDKMQIGYEYAKKVNHKIIYVALTGYGQTGSLKDKAGHDVNYLGYSGILGMTGLKNQPIMPSVQIADTAGGSYAAVTACLAALWARERTGKGQLVDVAMTDCVMPMASILYTKKLNSDDDSLRRGYDYLSGGLAHYNIYQCADGKWIALGSLEPKFFQGFCLMIGKPDWVMRMLPEEKTIESLREDLAALFLTKTQEEWLQMAAGQDICLTPIMDLDEVYHSDYAKERELFFDMEHPAYGTIKTVNQPFKFSETPAKPSWGAPLLGEDNEMLGKVVSSK